MRRLIAFLAAAITLAAPAPAAASAWTVQYQFGLAAPAGSHLGLSIVAVKRELAFNGYQGSMILVQPTYGDAARAQAKRFQTAQHLYVNGIVGPTVARYLFRKRTFAAEVTFQIPEHLLAKVRGLESANDPNAIGPSGFDHGLYQIHLLFHPEVTLEQAIDPAFSTRWTAESLRASYDSLLDWDAALAAHNVGTFYARKWLEAGKPPTGLVLSDGTDIFATATRYVALVRSRLV